MPVLVIHPDWTQSEKISCKISDKSEEEFIRAWVEEPDEIQDEFGWDHPLWVNMDDLLSAPISTIEITYKEYIKLVRASF